MILHLAAVQCILMTHTTPGACDRARFSGRGNLTARAARKPINAALILLIRYQLRATSGQKNWSQEHLCRQAPLVIDAFLDTDSMDRVLNNAR